MIEYIIGIDHGFGYVKTANHIFLSGVDELKTEPPLLQNVIEFEEKYYVVGEHRKPYSPQKTESMDYYILTLAAIAKEIIDRGKSREHINIILAVGLPLEYYGSQKKSFKKYLWAPKEVVFFFEGKKFIILIKNVIVFPQGYAVIADRLNKNFGNKTLVDIGTGTVDILPILDCKPQLSRCESLPYGVLHCIDTVQREFRQIYNTQLDEYIIQDLMQRKSVTISSEYIELVQNAILRYTEEIFKELAQRGIVMGMTQIIFCGGGATVIHKYGKFDKKTVEFIEDIHANAKGYEYLYNGIKN